MALRVVLTLEQCWHRVPGGTAVAAIGMARALDVRVDVDVVGVAARHPRPPREDFAPPVETFELPLPRVLLYPAWHRLRRPKVTLAAGPSDVVHATTIAIPPPSAPLVVTIHDLAWLRTPANFTPRGVRFFNRGLELARRDADAVVCPSSATASDLREAGFDRSKIHVVPLGVDVVPAIDSQVARVKSEYALADPYLLWVGTVEPRKNLAGLIAAWRALGRDVDLVLVGPPGWNEDLARLVGPDRARVKVLGFVPARNLAPLYAGASVFCWPSTFEGFGFPILEAMAQGTPVVTSFGSSTEEIAGEAAVLVDPANSNAIAEGIASILDDEALARKLADAGRERAGRYSWDRTAASLVEVYKAVAA